MCYCDYFFGDFADMFRPGQVTAKIKTHQTKTKTPDQRLFAVSTLLIGTPFSSR